MFYRLAANTSLHSALHALVGSPRVGSAEHLHVLRRSHHVIDSATAGPTHYPRTRNVNLSAAPFQPGSLSLYSSTHDTKSRISRPTLACHSRSARDHVRPRLQHEDAHHQAHPSATSTPSPPPCADQEITVKEASELSSHPSPDFTASPLDSNLFEWHFTLRGPPAPSPYAAGIYHGRIVLPSTYPLKPPNFRFLTPTGRFEVNREICLSISGHHEETWQPAWGIRTALVAIRSFMDSEARGQVGGLECDRAVRERMAADSAAWRCPGCAKSNAEILRENEEACAETDGAREEVVPEELRLAYREELRGETTEGASRDMATDGTPQAAPAPASSSSSSSSSRPPPAPAPVPAPQPTRTIPAGPPLIQHHTPVSPQWLDTAIYGLAAALLFMVLKKFAS